MSFIDWSKEQKTNHKAIDAEHKEIVDLLNEMYDKIIAKKEVKRLLYTYQKKIDSHFLNERNLMIDSEFKSFYSHDQEHKRFYSHLDKFVASVKEGNDSVSLSSLESWKTWLQNHLELKDIKLAKHLIEKKM